MSRFADERTDSDLLCSYAAGDRHAFDVLYQRHHGALYRLARRRCRTPEDADDAIQDAMLAVHRSAASFRQDAAVRSWLHRIVLNACTDRGREKGCLAGELESDAAWEPDRSSEVDNALVVRQALRRLPVGQRAAVLVVDMYGHSVADAACLLGVAEGTVKSRRARARSRLAVLLRQH